MSSLTEDRLAAALEARAELVTMEDLRPLEMPTRRRFAPTVVLLLAAAATTAVVAAPFVLDGATGPDVPGPAGTPSSGPPQPAGPSATPSRSDTPSNPPAQEPPGPPDAGRFRVVDTVRADLNGDGAADRVQLMVRRAVEGVADAKLEVVLVGEPSTSSSYLPGGWTSAVLLPPVDLNGDGREQVLLTRESGDATELMVFGWDADGGRPSVLWTTGGAPPLAAGWDARYRRTGYYLDAEGLHSWRTVEPMDPVGSTRVDVEEWSWSVRYDLPVLVSTGNPKDEQTQTQRIGTGLVPTSEGVRCADIATDSADPC